MRSKWPDAALKRVADCGNAGGCPPDCLQPWGNYLDTHTSSTGAAALPAVSEYRVRDWSCASLSLSPHAAPSTWPPPLISRRVSHSPFDAAPDRGFVVEFELGAAQLRDSGSVASCRPARRHVHPERSAAPGPPACPHTGRVARASQLAFRQSARHPPDFLCRPLWSCKLCTCGCTRDRLHASFPLKVQIFVFLGLSKEVESLRQSFH